jgi:probable rRNA maturation factor
MPKAQINFVGFNKSCVSVLTKAATLTLKHEKKRNFEINFILISDAQIKKLNTKYRKVRRITDVISFLVYPKDLIGDIYISKQRSMRQAKKYQPAKLGWIKELAYLTIHGTLHLCGYSDYDPKNKKIMFATQDKIFQCLFY